MGLVNCSECDRALSDNVLECYNCGNPIVAPQKKHIDGYQEEHTEKLKLHSIMSMGLIAGCIAWIIEILGTRSIETLTMPAVIIIPSIIWLVITRIRLWARKD